MQTLSKPDYQLLEDKVRTYSYQSLSNQLNTTPASFQPICEYIQRVPGKRYRTLVAVGWGVAISPHACLKKLCEAATAVELIHDGSLIHDDIIDESGTRRGQLAAHLKFGVSSSNNYGLFLISRGICQLYQLQKSCGIHLGLSQIHTIAKAQLYENTVLSNDNIISYKVLQDISDGKTGVLFKIACIIGVALNSDAIPDIEKYLIAAKNYGVAVGRAFQIRDDITDFMDTSESDGVYGADLIAGNCNWPITCWIRAHSNPSQAQLHFKQCKGNPSAAFDLISEIKEAGTLEKVQQELMKNIKMAENSLAVLPYNEGKLLLQKFLKTLGTV